MKNGQLRPGVIDYSRWVKVTRTTAHNDHPGHLASPVVSVTATTSFGCEPRPGASPIRGGEEKIADDITAYPDGEFDHLAFALEPCSGVRPVSAVEPRRESGALAHQAVLIEMVNAEVCPRVLESHLHFTRHRCRAQTELGVGELKTAAGTRQGNV